MNPGSQEARSSGCTCPVMDNGHGRGYMGMPGVFVYREGCPLHWDKEFTSLEQLNQEAPVPVLTTKPDECCPPISAEQLEKWASREIKDSEKLPPVVTYAPITFDDWGTAPADATDIPTGEDEGDIPPSKPLDLTPMDPINKHLFNLDKDKK